MFIVTISKSACRTFWHGGDVMQQRYRLSLVRVAEKVTLNILFLIDCAIVAQQKRNVGEKTIILKRR